MGRREGGREGTDGRHGVFRVCVRRKSAVCRASEREETLRFERVSDIPSSVGIRKGPATRDVTRDCGRDSCKESPVTAGESAAARDCGRDGCKESPLTAGESAAASASKNSSPKSQMSIAIAAPKNRASAE